MRISKFYIPESATNQLGLKEIDLTSHSLGPVVALVGKNGAGKTRILQFVENYIKTLSSNDIINGVITHLPASMVTNVAKVQELKIAALNKSPTATPAMINSERSKLKATIDLNVANRIISKGDFFIKKIKSEDLQKIKDDLILADSFTFPDLLSNQHVFDALLNDAKTTDVNNQKSRKKLQNEISNFNSTSTIAYLNKLSDDIIKEQVNLFFKNPDHLDKIKEEIVLKESYKHFYAFQNFLYFFLGNDFSYSNISDKNIINSELIYKGKPFNINLLSPGEKTLFAYAVLLFFNEINKSSSILDSILIIDEPEKHLHPEAQIKLVDALKRITNEKGQVWIATHSVHILSHLNHDEIFLVKDDEIIKPSRLTPGYSLNELMGLDNHINELSMFISSTSEWAYANFMKQCFIAPEIVFSDNLKDKQYLLFKDWINTKEIINLLDYGAGKGRLGHLIELDKDTKEKILYSAFDIDPNAISDLEKMPNVVSVFDNAESLNPENYDCVVLCNVLHEISPDLWIEVFEKIKLILKLEGKLLIIEDKFLPKGEKAHDFGYLILGEKELSTLFDIREKEFLSINGQSKEFDRILFSEISRNQINVTVQSIKSAIVELEKNSYAKLKEIRNDKTIDARIGRLYANQCQLHINAKIALEKF